MGMVDGCYALIATTAGLWLSKSLSDWTNWIELAGGVVLILLAFDIWWRARLRHIQNNPDGILGTRSQEGRASLTGLKFAAATALNPPTALYFLAIAPLVGTYAANSESLLQVAAGFSLGVWLSSSSWQQAVVAASFWLSHRITANWQYRIAVVGAALIIGFGIAAIWLGLS